MTRRPGAGTWALGGAFWLLFLALHWLAGRGLAWALDGQWTWLGLSWHVAVPIGLTALGLAGRWAWWRYGKKIRTFCSWGLLPEAYAALCRLHDNAYGKWGRFHPDGRLYTRREADDELWAACVAAGMARWKADAAWVFIRLALGWRWDDSKESKQPVGGASR